MGAPAEERPRPGSAAPTARPQRLLTPHTLTFPSPPSPPQRQPTARAGNPGPVCDALILTGLPTRPPHVPVGQLSDAHLPTKEHSEIRHAGHGWCLTVTGDRTTRPVNRPVNKDRKPALNSRQEDQDSTRTVRASIRGLEDPQMAGGARTESGHREQQGGSSEHIDAQRLPGKNRIFNRKTLSNYCISFHLCFLFFSLLSFFFLKAQG